jgi:hypothetical protein
VRRPRELLEAGAAAALPTVRLGRRVHRLEEAVRENALLARPLEAEVDRLEQSLVPVLEESARQRRVARRAARERRRARG